MIGDGIANARTLEVGSEEYHSIYAVSTSMLKAYFDDPETAYERYVLRTAKQKESKAFEFGKRLERMVFFNEQPKAVVIPLDVMSKRKKAGTDDEYTYAKSGPAWLDFKSRMEAEHGPDVLLVKQEEFDRDVSPLLIAHERLREHPAARKLLWGRGEPHVSILWDDVSNGIPYVPHKCQLDILSSAGVIVDLKTISPANSKDTYAFQRHVWEYKYHWQSWQYRHAVKALTGDLMPFVFVFVQSEEPFRVRVFELPDDWYEAAEAQVRATLQRLVWSLRSDVWRPEHWGEIEQLPILRWAPAALEDSIL
jgi:hypothetical protein